MIGYNLVRVKKSLYYSGREAPSWGFGSVLFLFLVVSHLFSTSVLQDQFEPRVTTLDSRWTPFEPFFRFSFISSWSKQLFQFFSLQNHSEEIRKVLACHQIYQHVSCSYFLTKQCTCCSEQVRSKYALFQFVLKQLQDPSKAIKIALC